MSRPDACTGAKEHRAEVVRRALAVARPPTPPTRLACWRRRASSSTPRWPASQWAGRPRERMPVVLDGVSTMAAALAALAFVPLLPTD